MPSLGFWVWASRPPSPCHAWPGASSSQVVVGSKDSRGWREVLTELRQGNLDLQQLQRPAQSWPLAQWPLAQALAQLCVTCWPFPWDIGASVNVEAIIPSVRSLLEWCANSSLTLTFLHRCFMLSAKYGTTKNDQSYTFCFSFCSVFFCFLVGFQWPCLAKTSEAPGTWPPSRPRPVAASVGARDRPRPKKGWGIPDPKTQKNLCVNT